MIGDLVDQREVRRGALGRKGDQRRQEIGQFVAGLVGDCGCWHGFTV